MTHPTAGRYTLGVLVQTNYSGVLTIDGVPVAKELGLQGNLKPTAATYAAGSCMIVVATDAPLGAWELRRLAFRALAGMARTGANFGHGSGDYVIAFSSASSVRVPHNSSQPLATYTLLRQEVIGPLFQAAAEATEEAIYNSMLRATTVRGFAGHQSSAISIEELRRVLKKYGRGK